MVWLYSYIISIFMKKLLLCLSFLFLCFWGFSTQTYAIDIEIENGARGANNLNIGSFQSQGSQVSNNDRLNNIADGGQFIEVTTWGERGLFNTLIRFARDLKNLFFAIATLFFLIIIFRLILADNTEEELWKFKKWIIWITVGLIVMQLAFSFTKILFDRGVGETLAFSLIQNLIQPVIDLLMTLASVFFLAMAIFAFYRIVTANGNEENYKKWRMTILYAIFGFIIIRFSRAIVEAFYGRIDCNNVDLWIITIEWGNCLNRDNISGGVEIITTLINWLNSFVAIVVVIMIIYVGVQILLSAGDEEKLKKAKQAIIYIAIGLWVIVTNYLIVTFFLIPTTVI